MGRERQKHNCKFELQTERMENLDKPSGIQLGTKIKFVGDRAKDQFPSLQGKCTSGKSGLTRSLNSLDAAVEAFSNMEEIETLFFSVVVFIKPGHLDLLDKIIID